MNTITMPSAASGLSQTTAVPVEQSGHRIRAKSGGEAHMVILSVVLYSLLSTRRHEVELTSGHNPATMQNPRMRRCSVRIKINIHALRLLTRPQPAFTGGHRSARHHRTGLTSSRLRTLLPSNSSLTLRRQREVLTYRRFPRTDLQARIEMITSILSSEEFHVRLRDLPNLPRFQEVAMTISKR